MATAPLLAVLMLGRLHFAPWQYGLAFAGPCVGGLIGSRLARRLVARFGRHKVMLTAGTLRACFSVGLAFIGPGAAGLVLVMAIELGLITSAGVFNPVYATYRLDQTPADRVARTLSAWSVTSNATIAALTAVWGVLASLTSLRAALAIAGLLLLATPLLLPRREHAAPRGAGTGRFRRTSRRRPRVTWGSRSGLSALTWRLWRQGKRYPDGVAEHQRRPDQGPDVGILVTIRALLPNLAPVERRVAQIVLDDPAGVAWRSISELARSCGTSATSVVRFCRAVGLRGYPELRLALAGAVAHDDAAAVAAASSDIDPDDDAATITKKIAFADARAVTDTASHLNIATLTQVVDALAKASRIDIYGVGASGYVALDLQQKLQRIGRPAFAWPDPHMAITSASLREHGDVAIGLSHTGTTVDTIDALREARGHGAVTAAVTNFPWSPITEAADFVLLTAARETAFRSGAMTSRIAQLTVVDCLFVTLAQQDLPRTRVALERTFAAAQAKRVRRPRRPPPGG